MDLAIFTLLCLNFIYVASLPLIFFSKAGRLNLLWFLTALPFFICPLFLFLSFVNELPNFYQFAYFSKLNELWQETSPYRQSINLVVEILSLCSIALISFTLGTHKKSLSLWHQKNDLPQELVTYGAYAYIRHPFYAAFLLLFLASAVFIPHLVTFSCFIYISIMLNYTAAKEEQKISSSKFASQYKKYMKFTGRFFPRLKFLFQTKLFEFEKKEGVV